jgi:hypothetical protein
MFKELIEKIKALKDSNIEELAQLESLNYKQLIDEVLEVIESYKPKVLDKPDYPGAWLRLGEEWNLNEQKWEPKWIATEVYRRPGEGNKSYFYGNMRCEYEVEKWKWIKVEMESLMIDEETRAVITRIYQDKKRQLLVQNDILRQITKGGVAYPDCDEIHNWVSIATCLRQIERLAVQIHLLRHLYEDELRFGEISDSNKG